MKTVSWHDLYKTQYTIKLFSPNSIDIFTFSSDTEHVKTGSMVIG